jgi:hypothetical protein
MQPAGASSGRASRISIKQGCHQECGWPLRVDPAAMLPAARLARVMTLGATGPLSAMPHCIHAWMPVSRVPDAPEDVQPPGGGGGPQPRTACSAVPGPFLAAPAGRYGVAIGLYDGGSSPEMLDFYGAGEGIRTLDPNLGKEVLGPQWALIVYRLVAGPGFEPGTFRL